MEFDDGEPVPEVEGIPLADDVTARTKPAQGGGGQERLVERSHRHARRVQEIREGESGNGRRRRRRLPP